MERHGLRRTLSVLVVMIAIAGCGSGPATPSPTGATSASPGASTASPTPSPAPATPATTPTAARWVPAGSLGEGRASTHATALPDGRVLVVGSDNTCTPGGAWPATAEVFDPVTAGWAATASLNAPRSDFVAVALPDGRVLVTGGVTSVHDPLGIVAYSSTKLYDPATRQWSATGLLDVARSEPAAAALPDGTVLVAGGAYLDSKGSRVLASAEIYDPETGAWSPTGSMPTARRGAQAVTLADGRVLVVGGSPSGVTAVDVGSDVAIAGAEVYDPSSGSWSQAGFLATARRGFSLVALPDGGALVVGGFVGPQDRIQTTASAERLSPKTMTWVPASPMHMAAANRAAAALGDGRVLVAGGLPTLHVSPVAASPATADAELYDPTTGAWSPATPLPESRERASAVTLPDRTVLFVGGDRGFGEPSTPWCPEPVPAALRYVPENLASFPKPATAAIAQSSVARATANPADAKKAAASITAFGIDLYKRMLADASLGLATKNAVVSPTSVALALGMARAGARGATAAQMDKVLHASGWDALGAGFNALEQALASRDATWKDEEGKTHQLALRLANAAFAQQGWAIVQGYLDAIAAVFGAGLRLVDYTADPGAARAAINAWVKAKTAGRIPKLIPDQPPAVIDEATRLVLVNAMYLKANWEIEFGREYLDEPTKPARFTTLAGSKVNVPTMSLAGGQTVPYATGSVWKATELRYLGGAGASTGDVDAKGPMPLAMTLIQPDNLVAFEGSLTPPKLAGVLSNLDAQRKRLQAVTSSGEDGDCGTYSYSVHLFMPRFGIDTAASLKGLLEALGMPLAFDASRADFSGIHVPEGAQDRVYIGAVIHQANIDVDEKGTEAAAATAVVMSAGGCTGPEPAKTVTLRLDHPFLFVLRDVQTGAILFMGRVVDPSAKK